MSKVFIVHGLNGKPNGGWRPWLMAELHNHGVYACALAMPEPHDPDCLQWVKQISHHVDREEHGHIILVGHSLGVSAILRYLEQTTSEIIIGAVLVSGPITDCGKKEVRRFTQGAFSFETIKQKVPQFIVIHAKDDDEVRFADGEELSQCISAKFIRLNEGGHLSSKEDCTSLPECLKACLEIIDTISDRD
jgi:predicted alpha/beta hydrolase family esterase